MKLKEGVKVEKISAELFKALIVLERYYNIFNVDMVITSMQDGHHKLGSKHYTGNGADIRIRDITDPDILDAIINQSKKSLGINYDIVLEKDHIHLEFDPKY